MLLKQLFIVSFFLCPFICVGAFDFNDIYFVKDAIGVNGKIGKYLYYKEYGNRRFGYIVNCDESTSQFESSILKSITGFSSPLIKVPLKNRIVSDAFNSSHLGIKDYSLLRLCPASANNEIEFYKYLNYYYLRFINNFGSDSFSEILVKTRSIPLIKVLLGKDVISSNDYMEIDQDPVLDGNEVFEINTISDDFVEPTITPVEQKPVFDVNNISSESYVNPINEQIETYIKNKDSLSVKADIVFKLHLKDRYNAQGKDDSVLLEPMKSQYLFSESLLTRCGYKKDQCCNYVFPYRSMITNSCVADRVESVLYQDISVLTDNEAEKILKSREIPSTIEKSNPILSERDIYLITDKLGSSKYSMVVSKNNKAIGYTIKCQNDVAEDQILKAIWGDSTPDVKKINYMNSHEFYSKFDIDPASFLVLCPSVESINKISLYFDGEMYYLKFSNNFGNRKYMDSYHSVRSVSILTALNLDSDKAMKIAPKDMLGKEIYELEKTLEQSNIIAKRDIIAGKEIAKVKFLGNVREDLVKFIPNSQYFIIRDGLSDADVQIWNYSGVKVATLIGSKKIHPLLAISPNGKYIATISDNHIIKIWTTNIDRVGQNIFPILNIDIYRNVITLGNLFEFRFSPDSEYIMINNQGPFHKIWDLAGNERTSFPDSNSSVISYLQISSDSQYLAAAIESEKIVKLWNVDKSNSCKINECAPFRSYDGMGPGSAKLIAFTSDKQSLITCFGGRDTKNSTLKIWNIENGKEVGRHIGNFPCTSFRFFGKYIKIDENDQSIFLNPLTGEKILTDLEYELHFVNYDKKTNSNGQYIILAGGYENSRDLNKNTAQIYYINIDEKIFKKHITLYGHFSEVLSTDISFDGKYALTSSKDHMAKIWDVLTGNELLTLRGHTDEVGFATFSPDGKYIFTASEKDRTFRIWNSVDSE